MQEAIKITQEHLNTSVINAPGGGGKIPIMPNYLISWATNKVVLKNDEGEIKPLGISKLLSDYEETIILRPENLDREQRNQNDEN